MAGIWSRLPIQQCRQRRVRIVVAMVAALVSVVGLSGCGGDGSRADTESVVLGESAKVTTLDPNLAYQDPDVHAVGLLAGTLYSYDHDGNVGPGLAQSGAASADQLSWSFQLRPDLKFSDGTPLTSADVVATLERVRTNPENIFASLVSGWKQVTAIDPQTVRIELTAPTPKLDAVLSYPFTMIVPAARAGDSKYYDAPVSAGMFALVSWGGGSEAKFVRNENYWGAKPVVKNITVTAITDANTRISQVRSGQVNFAPFIPPSLADQVTDPAKLIVGELYGFYSLVPNNTVAPFNDQGVRKAMSLAVDRDQINKIAWRGKSEPLAGFWPPKMDGYDKSVSTARDVDAAKAALRGTACERGCATDLFFTSGYPAESEMATIIKQNLADIGITVNLQDLDPTTLYSRLADGNVPMYIGIQQDYVNQPTGLLNYALQQGASEANFSFYKSPQMEQLIAQAAQASGETLGAALKGINDLFLQDVPYINLTPWTTFAAANLPEDDLVSQAVAGTYEFKRE